MTKDETFEKYWKNITTHCNQQPGTRSDLRAAWDTAWYAALDFVNSTKPDTQDQTDVYKWVESHLSWITDDEVKSSVYYQLKKYGHELFDEEEKPAPSDEYKKAWLELNRIFVPGVGYSVKMGEPSHVDFDPIEHRIRRLESRIPSLVSELVRRELKQLSDAALKSQDIDKTEDKEALLSLIRACNIILSITPTDSTEE